MYILLGKPEDKEGPHHGDTEPNSPIKQYNIPNSHKERGKSMSAMQVSPLYVPEIANVCKI